MVNGIFITAIIIILSILSNKFSHKVGIPSLLFFIGLGLFFGSDGVMKIPFDNYKLAETVCTISLVFIMFYGGFGTRWKTAKPVAVKALCLSTLGVIFTAFFVGVFCYFILKMELMESFLVGAVISSTDAASVFSVLRSKKLALKDKTSPILEVESGSNDPSAYMLTIVILEVMEGAAGYDQYASMIFAQFFVGILCAVTLAYIALAVYRRFSLESNGLETIFMVAMILLSFALPVTFGGNGFLSTYIFGIILGNQYIKRKRVLVNFFDGLTGLMQILIFFLLGLLAFPSQMPQILLTAVAIALFLTFIARPVSIFMILKPMKCSLAQIALVSWAGIRGASAIVFAIIAIVSPAYVKNDIFHIVFCIVLLSIAFQGTFLPYVAKKLDMIDEDADVLKTFTDYQEENELNFIRLHISEEHPWKSLKLKEVVLPPETLIVAIVKDEKVTVPNGETVIDQDDRLIVVAPGFQDYMNTELTEIEIGSDHDWVHKPIKEVKIYPNTLIVMIRRLDEIIVPNGDTIVEDGDRLVLTTTDFVR